MRTATKKAFILNIYLICLAALTSAWPAVRSFGGPYGPVAQYYAPPTDAETIYYVAPDGDATAAGDSPTDPTTLEAAIERVVTGDAIILRGGTYRTGGLRVNQGITLQPCADEQPILKGTRVATAWEPLRGGIWRTHWPTLFPDRPADWWRRERNATQTPLHRFNNDMVFIDGRFLQSAGWEGELDENTYYIDYDAGYVYIGADPADKTVEITAFDSALVRTIDDCHGKSSDGKGLTVRGITFTQYAYRAIEIEGAEPEGPADEATFGKDVVGSLFEHCTITFCSRVAGYFRGDGLTMRHCLISDTSTEGVYVLSSADVLLERNIFRRNNIENITGYFPAAVKIFNQSHRAVCRDNLVIDHPNSNGIWYDVGNKDGVFLNNWLQDIGHIEADFDSAQFWPSRNAFFFEISKGAVCAGNVFVNCDHGVFVLNSSDVQIYQNTFVNSTVCIARTARSAADDHFGWHPATGPNVDARDGHVFVNNLLTGDETFTRPLLALSQPPALCDRLTEPQLKQINANVYVRRAETSAPLIYWSPVQNERCQVAMSRHTQLRRIYPDFETNGLTLTHYTGPLFKSAELGRYELLEQFPTSNATPLPTAVRDLLGWDDDTPPYIGAYRPCRMDEPSMAR